MGLVFLFLRCFTRLDYEVVKKPRGPIHYAYPATPFIYFQSKSFFISLTQLTLIINKNLADEQLLLISEIFFVLSI